MNKANGYVLFEDGEFFRHQETRQLLIFESKDEACEFYEVFTGSRDFVCLPVKSLMEASGDLASPRGSSLIAEGMPVTNPLATGWLLEDSDEEEEGSEEEGSEEEGSEEEGSEENSETNLNDEDVA